MKKIIYLCDRCGAQFDKDETSVASFPADLCHECEVKAAKMFDIFLNGGLSEEKPAKIEKRSAPAAARGGSRKRANLDLGKIAALRKAGWTFEKIADEVGVSAPTVTKYMDEAMEYYKEHCGEAYKNSFDKGENNEKTE